jgi:hypothetical protein
MPHSTYLPERMGSAMVEPTGSFEAGSYQEFKLTYTAGYFGIDDTGSLKIVHRFASDMGRPQFDAPAAANYVTVEASNGAVLHVEYDMKRNIRPWDKTLYIKVVRGFLREGDQIIVRFGDRRQGSPGMRIQTFCEETFEFKVLVDAIATYNYVELPEQPEIEIIPGPPVLYKAILPSLRRTGENFRLCLKGEDRWGNPSNQCEQRFGLRANLAIDGLPDSISFDRGEFSRIVEGLSVSETGDLIIELLDADGSIVARSNPCRFVESSTLLPYWGDLHGQSEETISAPIRRAIFTNSRATRPSSTFACTRATISRSPPNSGTGLTSCRPSSPRTVGLSYSPAGSGPGIPGSAAIATCYTCTRAARFIDLRTRWSTICPISKPMRPRPKTCSRRSRTRTARCSRTSAVAMPISG